MAGCGRRGTEGQDVVGLGSVRQARRGEARRGRARQARLGGAM